MSPHHSRFDSGSIHIIDVSRQRVCTFGHLLNWMVDIILFMLCLLQNSIGTVNGVYFAKIEVKIRMK